MKRITQFAAHAEDRIEEREVSITDCERILNGDWHFQVPSKRTKGAVVLTGVAAGRAIQIVVLPLGNECYKLITVVTPEG